jgi:hypothetical protein
MYHQILLWVMQYLPTLWTLSDSIHFYSLTFYRFLSDILYSIYYLVLIILILRQLFLKYIPLQLATQVHTILTQPHKHIIRDGTLSIPIKRLLPHQHHLLFITVLLTLHLGEHQCDDIASVLADQCQSFVLKVVSMREQSEFCWLLLGNCY